MPTLHSPAVITPGQLGPINRVFRPAKNAFTFTSSKGGWHKNNGDIGAGFLYAAIYGIKYLSVEVRCTALARRNAAYNSGSVLNHLRRMKGAFGARKALHQHF